MKILIYIFIIIEKRAKNGIIQSVENMKSYNELKQYILSESAKKLIPVGGEFELTGKCNLRCKMCYLEDERYNPLSTEEWKRIFRDAHQNGLFFALLTGGEVLTRSDFFELYNYLYDLGCSTVYTNAH